MHHQVIGLLNNYIAINKQKDMDLININIGLVRFVHFNELENGRSHLYLY
ncbi:hypothetical protein NIES2098_52230 [Calothrix sp. NIES-2098]|nr:hypothetical protein NIES2098_52230 [Calothrix sp. NIES-2098]